MSRWRADEGTERTAIALLHNPDALRVALWTRVPFLRRHSNLVRCLYPAWWAYLRYQLEHGRGPEVRGAPGSGRDRYLVRLPKQAGIGDQLSTAWSETYMLARENGLRFAHAPFAPNPHSPQVDWEDFFGLGDGEVRASDVLDNRTLKVVYIPPLDLSRPEDNRMLFTIVHRIYAGDRIVFHLGSGLYLRSQLDSSAVMPAVLREKYWRTRARLPEKSGFEASEVNLAVHIRRGDLALAEAKKKPEWSFRWVPDEFYLSAVAALRPLVRPGLFKVHVYSDGTEEDLKAFREIPDCALHLTEDPRRAFHQMVLADVLVASPSAFSLSAGRISRNLKLVASDFETEAFRLFIPTTPDWVRIGRDGLLTDAARQDILAFLRKHKPHTLTA
jgi:hypothetical protein